MDGGGKPMMKAVNFADGSIRVVEMPVPDISPGEVLIRTILAGICRTDRELFEGYYNFRGVPGHEFVGRVENAPGHDRLEGKRVVAAVNVGCGECRWCRSGHPKHCLSRRAVGIRGWDGAFAEYLKVPQANVHLVEDGILDEEAVFAEPLAAALDVRQQVRIASSDRVLVMGDGKLGLLIALSLRSVVPHPVLLGKHRDKLEIAEHQGIETIELVGEPGTYRPSREPGIFDVVVDATGDAQGVRDALRFLRPRGTLVLKTTSRMPSMLDLSRIVVDEIRVSGSRCGDLQMALSYLQHRFLDVVPLIDAVYPFEEAEKAFLHAFQPGGKKILLRWS